MRAQEPLLPKIYFSESVHGVILPGEYQPLPGDAPFWAELHGVRFFLFLLRRASYGRPLFHASEPLLPRFRRDEGGALYPYCSDRASRRHGVVLLFCRQPVLAPHVVPFRV